MIEKMIAKTMKSNYRIPIAALIFANGVWLRGHFVATRDSAKQSLRAADIFLEVCREEKKK